MVAAFSSACGRRKPVELDPGRARKPNGRKKGDVGNSKMDENRH